MLTTYNLWAKKYQVTPRRYSLEFKKAQPVENIRLQDSPTLNTFSTAFSILL